MWISGLSQSFKSRLQVAVAAYFDESGTHEGAGVMTLAGYVAAEEQWIKFSEEWLVLLHQFGLQLHAHACRMPVNANYY
jgi:hypothetical protein